MRKIIQFLNPSSACQPNDSHESKLIEKEFIADTNFINFNRLRIWAYFLVVFVLSQLYFDIFFGKFWSTGQVGNFMILDLLMAVFTIVILLHTQIRVPKSKEEITRFHPLFLYFYLQIHLLFGSAVSIIESKSTNGVPTYLLAVFSAATIFISGSLVFSVVLIISLFTLFAGLYYSGLSSHDMFTQYAPTVVLVIIAWILSRILYSSRKRTFYATKDLEIARNNLNATVRSRTAELVETNEKLMSEIHKRKRYENILEYEKKRAQEADRLKSVFLANMSHEIRTPLNGILGFSDLLQFQELSSDKRAHYHEIISSNSQQLLKIIDDIMDISMIESNQLKINKISFSVSNLFPDATDYFNNFMVFHNKEHLELIMEGFPDGADDCVYSDPARIQQVLYNLLSNGIKFTEKGYVKFGGKIEDNFILVYVADTGIGINPQIARLIFKAFRQGEETITRSYGGTGLGLSISKGIIELLDGMIWIDFSYKEGALLCFSIPRDDNTFKNGVLNSAKDFELLRRKYLLIIDDNTLESGYIPDIFRTQKANISWIKYANLKSSTVEIKPDLIVIETDKNNQELNDSLSHIAELYKDIPIIAIVPDVSNYPLPTIGARDFYLMRKPVNIQLMLVKCVEFLSRQSS
jgi:signal transduction histidine kinase